MFITFEGPDGSGKTTQLGSLADFLCQHNYPVLTTREPGGNTISEQIRSILFDLKNTEMVPRTEILLFLASRAQLVEQVIRPYLAGGGIVLCDRYADSTLAYQGYGHQVNLDQLKLLIDFATGGLKPDLTFLLDLEVQEGLRRREQGGNWNRLDAYTLAFHQRVRQGFLELAREEPQRWVTIEAGRPADQVQKAIRQEVARRLEIQQ
jgi:dTMP kinase